MTATTRAAYAARGMTTASAPSATTEPEGRSDEGSLVDEEEHDEWQGVDVALPDDPYTGRVIVNPKKA